MIALLSLYSALVFNGPFWTAVLRGRSWAEPGTLAFVAAMLVMLVAVHTIVLGLLAIGRASRPVLVLVVLCTGAANYFMRQYQVYLDPGMLANVLNTDVPESLELFTPGALSAVLFYCAAPIALILLMKIRQRPPWQAITTRLVVLLAAVAATVGSVLLVFQDFSSLMRNQREIRYLITPANYIYSIAKLSFGSGAKPPSSKHVVGADAQLRRPLVERKPKLLVLVVGETVRAENVSLNGYRRQTTPKLSKLDVLSFSDVTACGTSTEVSLPCMFSAIGRRDYDESRIRSSESLLHVLDRAKVNVLWKDNQSGCKGVCSGLTQVRTDAASGGPLCSESRCYDEILLDDIDRLIEQNVGDRVIVLHMLGNHGPAYYKRYPSDFRRFTPTCDTQELRSCTEASIVNTYDNAVLYTDHFLAAVVEHLRKASNTYDTAMLYVSDHGESLGENGLYLHGAPWMIAPSEQTQVPMILWLSPQLAKDTAIDLGCMAHQTSKPWAHDNLFHSVIGLFEIDTQAYEATLDITAACKPK